MDQHLNMCNSSSWHMDKSNLENPLFTVYYILVCIVAIPGNILALWVFFYNYKSDTNIVFLRNLALADISYILILPMRIIYHMSDNNWLLGEPSCRLLGFLFYLNMYGSLYFMMCISLDRFLAIVFPVKSMKVRKPVYAQIVSVILWVMLITSMLPLLLSNQTVQRNATTECLQLYREKTSRRALVSLSIAFIIPFIAVLCSYIAIVHALWRGGNIKETIKNKAIKLTVMILVIFVVCFVPYHVSRFAYILAFNQKNRPCTSTHFHSNRITSALTSLNGALDPIMYFFVTQKFRNAFLKLVCRKEGNNIGQLST
ncbi:uracil nucleotide/cysteinyl leukotriene receptor isoform X1 [Erpetoichthys calabaricus]|uniref:uracil nucleotide/cysteinyl leukotriene receptor isoform X1 n=2 Tax=Erpetoichthys calabaricus TaxID=27687 RepID=UPI00109F50A2|nr:uracil nucleotide/cysteinyl leukotriene receptor isoform X1 [Erpetoichthys calabaricus]